MGPKEVALVSEMGGPPICICFFATLGLIPEGRHLYLCNIGTFTSATASSGALFGKTATTPAGNVVSREVMGPLMGRVG